MKIKMPVVLFTSQNAADAGRGVARSPSGNPPHAAFCLRDSRSMKPWLFWFRLLHLLLLQLALEFQLFVSSVFGSQVLVIFSVVMQ